MKCSRCGREYSAKERKCPHCREPNPAAGVFQTSSVLISTGDTGRVYHSVDEIPPPLRTKLQETTNSENSATILIADRRGRSEIAKALRGLPVGDHGRIVRAILGEHAPGLPLSGRRTALLAVLILLALMIIALVLGSRV